MISFLDPEQKGIQLQQLSLHFAASNENIWTYKRNRENEILITIFNYITSEIQVFAINFCISEEELLPEIILALFQPIAALTSYTAQQNKFHSKKSVFVSFCFQPTSIHTTVMPGGNASTTSSTCCPLNWWANHCLCFPWIPTKAWWIWYQSFIVTASTILWCWHHTHRDTQQCKRVISRN